MVQGGLQGSSHLPACHGEPSLAFSSPHRDTKGERPPKSHQTQGSTHPVHRPRDATPRAPPNAARILSLMLMLGCPLVIHSEVQQCSSPGGKISYRLMSDVRCSPALLSMSSLAGQRGMAYCEFRQAHRCSRKASQAVVWGV